MYSFFFSFPGVRHRLFVCGCERTVGHTGVGLERGGEFLLN